MPEYTVRRASWIAGAHRPVGGTVTLTERQADYLIRSGQLTRPAPAPAKGKPASAPKKA